MKTASVLVYLSRCYILFQSGEVSMSGELKRSAIKERHALCIANMFVQQGSSEAASGSGGYMHQDSTNSCGESTGKKSSGATIISQQLSQVALTLGND